MYENNENYPQQSGNTQHTSTNGSNNSGYQEYYYSAGAANGSYGQTIDTTPITPSGKAKKKNGRGKKAVAVVCLGLVFGVTAGAAFSVPVTIANRELKATKQEIQQLQESLNAASSRDRKSVV